MSYRENALIIKTSCLAEGIYEMWLKTDKMAGEAVPGQFISVYSNDGSRLLPRPISLCEIDRENGRLRIVYRVTGEATGTEEFSHYQAGDAIELLGPLGNGFPLERAKGKRVFLIGGGIGIPPMVQLAKELDDKAVAIMGADTSFVPGFVFRICRHGLKVSAVEWHAPDTIPSASPILTIITP